MKSQIANTRSGEADTGMRSTVWTPSGVDIPSVELTPRQQADSLTERQRVDGASVELVHLTVVERPQPVFWFRHDVDRWVR